MLEPAEHAEFVDEWMERTCRELSARELIAVVDRAFAAVWDRANRTLGEMTLAAILDRVLHSAADRFPPFRDLAVEGNGLHCEALLEAPVPLERAELYAAFRFLLVEFLTVLGNLTAEILTPALHAQLSSIEAPKS